MNVTLSQRQRIVAAVVYLAILWGLYALIIRNIPGSEDRALLWFLAGALMVILGKYVVEPFFTTPADAIVNALALLVTLSSLSRSDQTSLIGYQWLQYYGYAILVIATVSIFLKDVLAAPLHLLARLCYRLSEVLGKSQVMFSVLYLLVSYSYFAVPGELGLFISALVLWVCLVFFDIPGKAIEEFGKVFQIFTRRGGDELGQAIG